MQLHNRTPRRVHVSGAKEYVFWTYFAFAYYASGVLGTGIPSGLVLNAQGMIEVENADTSSSRFGRVLEESPCRGGSMDNCGNDDAK